MRRALDNYARGKQIEVTAWTGQTIPAKTGRFICVECLENVTLVRSGHFSHLKKTPESLDCEKRVNYVTRNVYEKMGLPLFICQRNDGAFSLGVGFPSLKPQTLIDAENKHSSFSLMVGGSRNSFHYINRENFSVSGMTIIYLNERISDNACCKVIYSKGTPNEINKIWTDHSDTWLDNSFFTYSGAIGRRVRELGSIICDKEYLLVGKKVEFYNFNRFVKCEKKGILIKYGLKVYSFSVDSRRASDYEIQDLAKYLRKRYKVNLLQSESVISPIWPPCFQEDGRFIFSQETENTYLRVVSPNDSPSLYKYCNSAPGYEKVDSISSKGIVCIALANNELPLSVDRVYNGNIQYLCRRELQPHFSEVGVSVTENKNPQDVLHLSSRQLSLSIQADFPALIRIISMNGEDRLCWVSKDESTIKISISRSDKLIVYSAYGSTVFERETIKPISPVKTDGETNYRSILVRKEMTSKDLVYLRAAAVGNIDHKAIVKNLDFFDSSLRGRM